MERKKNGLKAAGQARSQTHSMLSAFFDFATPVRRCCQPCLGADADFTRKSWSRNLH